MHVSTYVPGYDKTSLSVSLMERFHIKAGILSNLGFGAVDMAKACQ